MNKKEQFVIEGLAGKKTLKGRVFINGAKNAALKAMAASILFDGEVVLNNIPNTEDIHVMKDILVDLGAKVRWQNDDQKSKVMKIDAREISKTDIKTELAVKMRASVVLTGPVLARFGKVSFPAPGGCVIGARPIDLFIDGYKKMGATVELRDGLYYIEAKNGLKGNEINFSKISVGGTETLMMAATLGRGRTILRNCAKEPEIGNVAEWLNACGANINGIGTDTLTIEGTGGKLLSPKNEYRAIPDRIEAGSFLILGALCAENLRIENCEPEHIQKTIDLLREAGVNISVEINQGKSVIVSNSGKTKFKAFDVTTKEYPGFPTDLQAPLVVFLSQAEGESKVTETIFEGRFKYVEDLVNMGADIDMVSQDQVLIKGPKALNNLGKEKELSAHDIRAGFAIVLASLVGQGWSVISNVHLIDRGYESLEKKLQTLGASVVRR